VQFNRYAIYYTPPKGALADFGASWLGWDLGTGQPVAHPDLPDLPHDIAELSQTPRKYGFHGTLKPPFRLAQDTDVDDLAQACATLCDTLAPLTLDGLELTRLGSFLAFTIPGQSTALSNLASEVVRQLDRFRAPPAPDELARRRKANLSPRQEALLVKWGYPYVMEEFRFHLTLTGRLPRREAEALRHTLAPHIQPLLPAPFRIDDLTLVGEDADGMFHEIQRFPLLG